MMALQAAFPVSQAAKELKPDVVMQVLIYNAGPGGISWPPPGEALLVAMPTLTGCACC